MASRFKRALLSFTEEDFSCPVCRDIFKHPVVLSCSHSFCKACLQEWWRHKDVKECPVCKNVSSVDDPPCNLALKNICETIVGPKVMVLEESRRILQEKLNAFSNVQTDCVGAAEHIEVQARETHRKIKEQFKKLHQFLHWEEGAKVTALWDEEEKKSQAMKEKIEGLNRDMASLSDAIGAIEEELRAEHALSRSPPRKRIAAPNRDTATLSDSIRAIEEELPQNHHGATLERLRLTLRDPQPVPAGSLINEAKHLGNLAFRVWDKMKAVVSYTPVILDPNTACPEYALSDSLTSVRHEEGGEERPLPDNPERFDYYGLVTGSEGFDSGTHSWDVWVGDNEDWEVGVLTESYQTKGEAGGPLWCVKLDEYGEYTATSRATAAPPGLLTVLRVNRPPWKIRVRLDWGAGRLSFSDPDADVHLHTFTHRFAERLFPYVYNGDDAVPLMMLPRKISVDTQD